jgi:histidinol dehydrogenase
VAETVASILADVRARGDAAVLTLEARFGGAVGRVRVSPEELQAAVEQLEPHVREAIELARDNVTAVTRAGLSGDAEVRLPQGHTVRLREVPVRRAGVYAPGGQAPYPSSVVMGVATARAAGVPEIAVCASHPLMLAAAALCGADEAYRMGGAQAIGALAYGTESVRPVDVVVGPGSLWAQEAKRQVFGEVGIDGFAGPSDLLVIAGADADPELVGADLAAQAEHGEGTVSVLLTDAPGRYDGLDLVACEDLDVALAVAEAFAPEHLSLQGAAAEALAPRVTRSGCVFVGPASAVAFGDYVAGSNHVLPTEGAARFASGLNARHFLRRMSEVRIDSSAAAALAGPGAALARAEGFTAHAASMEIRENRPT